MTKAARTDIHRPGAIIPADYECVLMYSLAHSAGGFPMRAIGVDCTVDRRSEDEGGNIVWGQHGPGARCCVAALRASGARFAATGGLGSCSVCGVGFLHGSVWRHTSGEHIYVGHICADKYELMADWSAHERALDRLHAATGKAIQAKMNAEARARFLAAHPGLESALQTDHRIIADIASYFRTNHTMSEKQVALVMKLHNEIVNPAPKVDERHVAAPTGRVTFTGLVVSAREHDSQFGTTIKVTVKVTTPDGATWLAWGTAPRNALSEAASHGGLRGCTVEFTATLKPGREPHFALMSRPIGRVIAQRVAS